MRTPRVWALPTEPVSVAVLRQLGVSREMLRTQLAAGRLLRLRHGVYLAASAWPTDPSTQQLLRARAEVVANPGGVISDQSAALVWDLPSPDFVPWSDLPPSITFPAGGPHTAQTRGRMHRVAQLPPAQLARDPAGFAVTSVARTAVDLASSRPLPESLGILDAAARRLCASYVAQPRRRDFTNPRFVAAARGELSDAAATRPGTSLTTALSLVEPARESVAESLSAGHFEVSGLPRPLFQASLDTAVGTVFPDCYWADFGVVGECDGAVKYTDAQAYVREKQREQAIRDLGLIVVRWLASEIMLRPDLVIDRVARALSILR